MLCGLGVRKEKLGSRRKEKEGVVARTAGAVRGAGASSKHGTGGPGEDPVGENGRN